MTFTRALGTNNYGPAKFIVDGTTIANGTHSTIADALTSASSGDTIFIRPGTYTENLTLKAGVNLTAYTCDGLNPNVTIIGKLTGTFTGSSTITGIRLQTNSDYFLEISGSNATAITLSSCFLNISNNTGINYTSSSSSASLNILYCIGRLATTGIGFYTCTSPGSLVTYYVQMENASSTTASTNSANTVSLNYSNLPMNFTTSSTGSINAQYSSFGIASTNTTAITTAGTGSGIFHCCRFHSGSAVAISAGSGTTVSLYMPQVESTNTNPIGGAGTVVSTPVAFSSTGFGMNASTMTDRAFGRKGTWTPVLSFGGGSTGIAYSTQSGVYQKIGNLVVFNINLQLTNKGSSTGLAAITAPFTSANDNTFGVFVSQSNTTLVGTNSQSVLLLAANSSSLLVVSSGIGSPNQLSDTNFANNSFWRCSGSYWTA